MNISTFYGTHQYAGRKSHVCKEGNTYVVTMIQDAAIVEEREITGHTQQYAEDLAENWVLGII